MKKLKVVQMVVIFVGILLLSACGTGITLKHGDNSWQVTKITTSKVFNVGGLIEFTAPDGKTFLIIKLKNSSGQCIEHYTSAVYVTDDQGNRYGTGQEVFDKSGNSYRDIQFIPGSFQKCDTETIVVLVPENEQSLHLHFSSMEPMDLSKFLR